MAERLPGALRYSMGQLDSDPAIAVAPMGIAARRLGTVQNWRSLLGYRVCVRRLPVDLAPINAGHCQSESGAPSGPGWSTARVALARHTDVLEHLCETGRSRCCEG